MEYTLNEYKRCKTYCINYSIKMSSKEHLQILSFEKRLDTFELEFSSKVEPVHLAAAGFERGAMQFPD